LRLRTGSLPFAKTIGILPVADFAAIAETTLLVAKITATFSHLLALV
jgi:hypothetical protein